MAFDNKLNDSNDEHRNRLKKATELSKANLKVFDEDYLYVNKEDIFSELKSINLTDDDIKELLQTSSASDILATKNDSPSKDIMSISKKETLGDESWYVFVDIVSLGSKVEVPEMEQLGNITTLITLIQKSLQTYSVSYCAFTGDGIFIVFPIYENAIKFSVNLQKEIYKHNRISAGSSVISSKRKSEIHIRIGIGEGVNSYLVDLSGKLIPWSKGVITAQRIVNFVKKDEILLSESVYRKLGENNRIKERYSILMDKQYDLYLKYRGEKIIKVNPNDETSSSSGDGLHAKKFMAMTISYN